MPLNRRRFLALALGWPVVASAAASNATLNSQPIDLVETLLSRAHLPRYSNEVWLLINDQESTLSVYRGDTLVELFSPVSLGRSGAKTQRVMGDNVTPLGEFRINRFNYESRWHIFIGIDYPTPARCADGVRKWHILATRL